MTTNIYWKPSLLSRFRALQDCCRTSQLRGLGGVFIEYICDTNQEPVRMWEVEGELSEAELTT